MGEKIEITSRKLNKLNCQKIMKLFILMEKKYGKLNLDVN